MLRRRVLEERLLHEVELRPVFDFVVEDRVESHRRNRRVRHGLNHGHGGFQVSIKFEGEATQMILIVNDQFVVFELIDVSQSNQVRMKVACNRRRIGVRNEKYFRLATLALSSADVVSIQTF